jgi:O-antigen ligase
MLIPTLAVFLSAVSLPDQLVKRLVYVFLLMASVQGVLGLIQYASDDLFFVFGMDYHGRMAQGMYVNRDHFAALMEMALPMALALMLYSIGRTADDRQHGGLGGSVNRAVLFAFAALVIFLAAIFSRSRTGVFLVLLMVLLSSVVFSRHIGGKQSVGWASAFAVIAGGIGMSVGLIPVLNRFIAADPLEDGRWPIFETTLTVIREFFPLGSGPGTYAEMYRAFQPAEQAFFANHAHNDYLELLVEMGAAGVFVIAGFMVVYLYGWIRLRKFVWNRMRFLQVGSGLAVLAILLHSLLDFNLHTPANFVVFAMLVGIFFRKNRLSK